MKLINFIFSKVLIDFIIIWKIFLRLKQLIPKKYTIIPGIIEISENMIAKPTKQPKIIPYLAYF